MLAILHERFCGRHREREFDQKLTFQRGGKTLNVDDSPNRAAFIGGLPDHYLEREPRRLIRATPSKLVRATRQLRL